MALSRDQIKVAAAAAREPVTFTVPEWGGDVLLAPMTGADRDSYEAAITRGEVTNGNTQRVDFSNVRAKLVARCLVDETSGKLMFDWRNAKDIAELGDFDAGGLDRVFKECQRINKMGRQAETAAVGNSQAAESVATGSDSLSHSAAQ